MFTPMPAGRTGSGKSAALATERQKTITAKIGFVFITQQRRPASRRIHTVQLFDLGQARVHPGHVPILENVGDCRYEHSATLVHGAFPFLRESSWSERAYMD